MFQEDFNKSARYFVEVFYWSEYEVFMIVGRALGPFRLL